MLVSKVMNLLIFFSVLDKAPLACDSNPCQNNGTCHEGYKSFTCECADNFYGDTCNQSMYFYRPQRSWGKVMFLHVSVILFTGGWYPSMHCRWYPSMPCSRSTEGYCCGRYASYWNAFLVIMSFHFQLIWLFLFDQPISSFMLQPTHVIPVLVSLDCVWGVSWQHGPPAVTVIQDTRAANVKHVRHGLMTS